MDEMKNELVGLNEMRGELNGLMDEQVGWDDGIGWEGKGRNEQ